MASFVKFSTLRNAFLVKGASTLSACLAVAPLLLDGSVSDVHTVNTVNIVNTVNTSP